VRKQLSSEDALGEDDEPQVAQDWMHGAISREDATTLLEEAGLDDGVFLLRTKPPDMIALAVVYHKRVTHHLIHQQPDGTFLLNKVKMDAAIRTLDRLLAAMATGKVQKWPVVLTDYVAASSNRRVPLIAPTTIRHLSASRGQAKPQEALPKQPVATTAASKPPQQSRPATTPPQPQQQQQQQQQQQRRPAV
jgi:hypothetical protein